MKCRAAKAKLSACLDADLPAREQAAVAAHLRSCAECQAEAARLRQAESALRTLAAVEPAPDLTVDLRRRLAARAPRRLSWRWAGAALAGAAAAAVVFWLIVRTAPTPPESPAMQVAAESPRVEPPASQAIEPTIEVPAPPPPRPVQRQVAQRKPQPEPAPAKIAEPEPEEPATDDVERLAGVILLLGSPQPAPSSGYYLEVTLPDGTRSVEEQAIERAADGRPRVIRIASHRIAPEAPGTN